MLDNLETLFESGRGDGRYREGLAGYGRLLQAAGEASHQSCLVVTSREAPPELAALSGAAVRALTLGGLGADEVLQLAARGIAVFPVAVITGPLGDRGHGRNLRHAGRA